MNRFFMCLISVCIHGTCALVASAADAPEWVTSGKHAKYPSTVYLSGVGVAGSQADAEANALSSIGKQIQVNVKSNSLSTMSSAGESVSAYFNQDVEVDSAEQIQGARFAERFNNADGTWSVLAVVKIDEFVDFREKMATDCLEKANKLLPFTSKDRVFASAAETFKAAVALRVKTHECGKYLAEFYSAMSLVPNVKKLAGDNGVLKKLEAQTQAAVVEITTKLSQLSFFSTCTSKIQMARKGIEPQSGLCEDFEKVVIDFGIAKGDEKSPFEVKMKYSAEEKGDGSSKLVFMRSNLSVEIVDKAKHTSIFKTTLAGEGAGGSAASAIAKMDKKSLETLSSSFVESFKKK